MAQTVSFTSNQMDCGRLRTLDAGAYFLTVALRMPSTMSATAWMASFLLGAREVSHTLFEDI